MKSIKYILNIYVNIYILQANITSLTHNDSIILKWMDFKKQNSANLILEYCTTELLLRNISIVWKFIRQIDKHKKSKYFTDRI